MNCFPFLLWTLLLLPLYSNGQVGINTVSPRKELEVAGSVKITEGIRVEEINSLKDHQTSTFLYQENNNRINSMDVSNPSGVALGYIQEYVIRNPNLDWIRSFDTKINAQDFVLIAISAHFDRELTMDTSNGRNFSIPYTATFIENGTWHIIADYPSASNRYSNEIGTWTITTLIYSRDLSKQFGEVNIQMNNRTTGSAAFPIIN